MDMRHFAHCPHCNGEGAIFEGAMMRPNPGSYADYDEIWSDCDPCTGRGWSWRFFRLRNVWDWLFPEQYQEEDEIPF